MIHKDAAQGITSLIQAGNTIPREVTQLQLPKLYQALDAWENILNDEDRVGANVNRESDFDEAVDHRVPLLHEWKHPPRGIPQAPCFRFVFSLPLVSIARIPPEDRKCLICMEEYPDEWRAYELPCGHRFCTSCIRPWLTPFEDVDRNTCPHCRAELFTKLPDIETIQGLQARCDAFDWLLKHSEISPSPRIDVMHNKLFFLKSYIHDAKVEVEMVSFSSDLLSPILAS